MINDKRKELRTLHWFRFIVRQRIFLLHRTSRDNFNVYIFGNNLTLVYKTIFPDKSKSNPDESCLLIENLHSSTVMTLEHYASSWS